MISLDKAERNNLMPRKKHGLKIFLWIVAAAALICLMVVLNTPQKRTLRYYHRHIDEIKADLKHHLETGEKLTTPKDIKGIKESKESGLIVEYEVTGRGLVPYSSYYGFYYSENNTPVA